MPSTFEAVAAAVFAVLPGALCVWGFERVAGRWTIGLSDRLLRFFGISAVLHAAVAPVTYRVWHDHLRDGALAQDQRLPLSLWAVVAAYVAVPIILGTVLGRAVEAQRDWARLFVASSPAPTAWDAVFSGQPAGWVLIKLKSDGWIGGKFDADSHAGGYPEPPDIFLSVEGAVDQALGDFVRDNQGDIVALESGVLVRWEDVEYLRVLQQEGT